MKAEIMAAFPLSKLLTLPVESFEIGNSEICKLE